MSSIMVDREISNLKIKIQNPKTFNIFDASQLLMEKNEALKPIELDDDFEDNQISSFETISTQDKETIINDSDIIIVSVRSCENNEFMLEKNIHKLEKYIKRKFKRCKKN